MFMVTSVIPTVGSREFLVDKRLKNSTCEIIIADELYRVILYTLPQRVLCAVSYRKCLPHILLTPEILHLKIIIMTT